MNEEGKFLYMKRGRNVSSSIGKWEAPGGRVEFGETMAEAAKREAQEELGVEVEVGEMLDVGEYIVPGKHHFIGPAFICKIIRGTPRIMEPDKCEEIGWFTPTNSSNCR